MIDKLENNREEYRVSYSREVYLCDECDFIKTRKAICIETKDSIVNIFPKENTLAIIIFGSFGTDRATYNSDIDIAWIPIKKVPITELAVKTQSLRNILDIDVDLKIVTDNYTVELRKNILEGDIIYKSNEFKNYLNNFYIENSDLIDILNWREMHGK